LHLFPRSTRKKQAQILVAKNKKRW